MLRSRKRRESVAGRSTRPQRSTADSPYLVQLAWILPLVTDIGVTITAMTDFLTEKRREIEQRLKELRPLVDEYHQLEAAVAALDGAKRPSAPARKRAAKAAPRRTSSK